MSSMSMLMRRLDWDLDSRCCALLADAGGFGDGDGQGLRGLHLQPPPEALSGPQVHRGGDVRGARRHRRPHRRTYLDRRSPRWHHQFRPRVKLLYFLYLRGRDLHCTFFSLFSYQVCLHFLNLQLPLCVRLDWPHHWENPHRWSRL